MNYITALPDFIEMQRISFCWFISEGLKDELTNFSSILDFSGNIEYMFFGQEYKLVKPFYNSVNAKKHATNYIAQLIMPIEMRNRQTNTIIRRGRLSIANLPLMTNSATFIINGCERVIVSQVIRSPGVYFERNKKQKRRKLNKLRLSTNFHKVRSFTQTSFGILRLPKVFQLRRNSKNFYFLQNGLIVQSSNDFLNFIEFFKLYTIISKTLCNQTKSQRSKNFFKLLKIINTSSIQDTKQITKRNRIILNYLNNLLKKIIKYQILQTFFNKKKAVIVNESNFLSQYENQQTQFLYKKKIKRVNFLLGHKTLNYQKLTQTLNRRINVDCINSFQNFYIMFHNEINLKYFEVLNQKIIKYNNIINQYENITDKFLTNNCLFVFYSRLNKIKNLSFLKTKITRKIKNLKKFRIAFEESQKLKQVIYFPIIKNYTRSDILKNKDYFEKKDIYKHKYEQKELYTATLIPEHGSWIRFGFLRNKKTDLYKYPITNRYEDDIVIQIDKIIKKPIIHLLREMGLKDLEISKNLKHSDYFYFNNPLLTTSVNSNNPLLRFNIDDPDKNISEFSRIFDSRYYRLGKIGRYKLNQRFNLKISQEFFSITYDDIFAIIDYLITLSITKTASDDIDHLKNRRVRSIGELIQQLFRVGFQRLSRKILSQVYKPESPLILTSNIISTTVREFFSSSQLSQYMDQTNPLASLTHKRRISGLGPGGFDRDRISFSVRDIHPSHYGRICPIETPEGKNVGLISSLTTCARVNESGFLETPFWRIINGKVIKTENPIYLTADIEDFYKIAPADISTNQENYLTKSSIPVRYKQDFITVNPSEIDFIAISTVQVVSVAASLIPFFEHDDANRALMGSNMQRQSVPLLIPKRPIIGTGLENQIAADSGMTINTIESGIVDFVSSKKIIVSEKSGKKFKYHLQKYQRSNQETCVNQRPIVWKGERVRSGQIIADGPSMNGGELALGQNILVTYMPWHGYNFEDAILINERLVYDDVFTSIHIERYEIKVNLTNENREQTTNNIPNLNPSDTQNLNENGIISIGTFVKSGDILLGKVTPKDDSDQVPEAKLLRAIFGAKSKGVRDNSFRMPNGESGRILRIIIFRPKNRVGSEFEKIQVFIAQIRKIQVGDKIAGRHGNKGIISRILPRQDMPFLPDGTPIDIILNPLGVPSRMNVGQLYECLLGLAGNKLNRRFKILPFDEVYGQEVSRILINKKLREASVEKNEAWLFNPYSPGKIVLVDGRTGKEFENPITVGNAYMLKLIHLVDDKMHARATGPYSLVTQQPLGGKAKHGGQRFGEMEVWALEGFGAAYTLKELLTIKSDDMQGRNDTLDAIVKGQIIPTSGIPESFKVLLQELRSIGLDISTYQLEKFSSNKTYEIEVNLMENYDVKSKTFSPTLNINNILF